MLGIIIGAAAQILDIVLKHTSKNPETVPSFAPIIGSLIGIASRAAGETAEETAARMTAHNAIVAKYAAGPPPGANLPPK